MATDTTRDRILSLIVTAGPITAAQLATELGVTPAGIRRHLTVLLDDGYIVDQDVPGPISRGRGRPSRAFVATPEGQRALSSAYANVAVQAQDFMREHGVLDAFIDRRMNELEVALRDVVPTGGSVESRVSALAEALGDQGFATSVRPGPGGLTVQLCQGHCPVQILATHANEWCEAETRVISRVLDVHVQRLSTLANGAHVCTTTVPLISTGFKEG